MNEEIFEAIDSAVAEQKTTNNKNEEELNLDDLGSGNWVSNPEVGKSTGKLKIQKLVKNFNIKGKTKDGQEFSTALSKVDYKIDIHTDQGIFSPSSWEVWGKIKALARKAGEIKGASFEVEHLVDGGYATEGVSRIAKMEGVSEEEAEKIKQNSIKAKKDKKLYIVRYWKSNGEEVFL